MANARKMGGLGTQIQGKPTPERAAQLGAIQKQRTRVVRINTYSLLLSLLFMAIAGDLTVGQVSPFYRLFPSTAS